MRIPEKSPRNKLSDTILNSRWLQFALNGVVLVCSVASAALDFYAGSYVAFGTMCFVAGVSITIIVYTCITPGLFRAYGEAESAIMRAQLEKDMNATFAEIKRQHPEIEDIQIQRVQ